MMGSVVFGSVDEWMTRTFLFSSFLMRRSLLPDDDDDDDDYVQVILE